MGKWGIFQAKVAEPRHSLGNKNWIFLRETGAGLDLKHGVCSQAAKNINLNT